MEIKENIFLSLVTAGKIDGDEELKEHLAEANGVPPCCNRNWWYWKPTFKKTRIGWEIMWLFVMISYDNHNIYMRKYKEQQRAQEETKDV